MNELLDFLEKREEWRFHALLRACATNDQVHIIDFACGLKRIDYLNEEEKEEKQNTSFHGKHISSSSSAHTQESEGHADNHLNETRKEPGDLGESMGADTSTSRKLQSPRRGPSTSNIISSSKSLAGVHEESTKPHLMHFGQFPYSGLPVIILFIFCLLVIPFSYFVHISQ